MRFDKVNIVGKTTVSLPIYSASPTDQILLREIVGLDSPDINIFMAQAVGQGNIYQGNDVGDRQIVITVGLNPNYGANQRASDIRELFYGLLVDADEDSLRLDLLLNNVIVASIRGYIVKMDNAAFSQSQLVQLTMNCLGQFLYGASVNVPTAGLSKTAPSITNPGSAPSGFRFELTFNEATPNFIIYNSRTTKRIALVYAFLTGDRLIIDTRSGLRQLSRTRSGNNASILHTLTSESKWLMLNQGVNTFPITTDVAFTWNLFTFAPMYWGV